MDFGEDLVADNPHAEAEAEAWAIKAEAQLVAEQKKQGKLETAYQTMTAKQLQDLPSSAIEEYLLAQPYKKEDVLSKLADAFEQAEAELKAALAENVMQENPLKVVKKKKSKLKAGIPVESLTAVTTGLPVNETYTWSEHGSPLNAKVEETWKYMAFVQQMPNCDATAVFFIRNSHYNKECGVLHEGGIHWKQMEPFAAADPFFVFRGLMVQDNSDLAQMLSFAQMCWPSAQQADAYTDTDAFPANVDFTNVDPT
jgi:hypothetical protein